MSDKLVVKWTTTIKEAHSKEFDLGVTSGLRPEDVITLVEMLKGMAWKDEDTLLASVECVNTQVTTWVEDRMIDMAYDPDRPIPAPKPVDPDKVPDKGSEDQPRPNMPGVDRSDQHIPSDITHSYWMAHNGMALHRHCEIDGKWSIEWLKKDWESKALEDKGQIAERVADIVKASADAITAIPDPRGILS